MTVVVRPDGTVVVDVLPGISEQSIWWVAFPSNEQVDAAKARGARAFRREVREIGGKG